MNTQNLSSSTKLSKQKSQESKNNSKNSNNNNTQKSNSNININNNEKSNSRSVNIDILNDDPINNPERSIFDAQKINPLDLNHLKELLVENKVYTSSSLSSVSKPLLERIVQQTLSAPDPNNDAHVRIVDYIRLIGASPEEIESFKVAWSKILAGNEAFGRKNTKINPELFAKELVNELRRQKFLNTTTTSTNNNNSFMKKNNSSSSSSSSYQTPLEENFQFLCHLNEKFAAILQDNRERNYFERENIYQALDNHDTLLDEIDQYYENLYSLPKSYFLRDREILRSEFLTLEGYHESIEKAKIKWEKLKVEGKFARVIRYEPIEDVKLSTHFYRYGHLTIPVKRTPEEIEEEKLKKQKLKKGEKLPVDFDAPTTKKVIIPKYWITDKIIGIEIIFDDSDSQDFAFLQYSQFLELSVCRYFNPFPKPLNYDYIEDGGPHGSVLFIFEYPDPVHLLDYLLPSGKLVDKTTQESMSKSFPNLLRKYPSIVCVWATQLAVAVRQLSHLMTSFQPFFDCVNDTMITSDGTLLLNGINLCEFYNHLSQEEFEEELEAFSEIRNTNNELHRNLQKFTKYVIYPILSNALATSRFVEELVEHTHSFKCVGSGLGNPDLTFNVLKDPENKSLNLYPTYYITKDSALCIELIAGDVKGCRVFRYDEIYGKPKNRSNQNEDMETEIESSDLPQQPSMYSIYTEFGSMVGIDENSEQPVDFDSQYDLLSVIYSVDDCEVPDYTPEIKCRLIEVQDLIQDIKRPRVQLQIKSMFLCTVNMEIAALITNYTDAENSERRWTCIRVQVIPEEPTASVELQDLIFHLEEFYDRELPNTIFHSALFQAAHPRLLNDDVSRAMVTQCCYEWNLLQKEVQKV